MARSPKYSLFVSSLIYGVGDLLTKGARVVLLPIYVLALTSDQLGEIAICQAISLATWNLLCFGTNQFVLRFYDSTDRFFGSAQESRTFVSTLWFIRFAFGVVAGAVLAALFWLWTKFGGEIISLPLILASIATGHFRAALSVSENSLIADKSPLRYRALTFLVFLSSAALIIFLILVLKIGVWGVVMGECAALGTWALGLGVWHIFKARPVLEGVRWSTLFAFCLPIVPHSVFMSGLVGADRLILTGFVEKAAIGIYDISYLLGSGIAISGAALLMPWLPEFYRRENLKEAGDYFKKRSGLQILTCLMIAITTNLFAYELACVMVSKYATESVDIIRLILIAAYFMMLAALFVKPLIHLGQTKTIACLSGAALTLNIASNFWLDPMYGIFGAAYSSIAAYLFLALAAMVVSTRQLELKWIFDSGRVIRIAVVAALFGFAGLAFQHQFTLSFVLVKIAIAVVAWGLVFVRLDLLNPTRPKFRLDLSVCE